MHSVDATPSIVLDGGSLTIFDVVHAARDGWHVELAQEVWRRIAEGRNRVEQALREGATAYGVTTGVGSQKDYPLPAGELTSFNRRLLVAHATLASDRVLAPRAVRAALVVQLNGFLRGTSGVRPELVRRLWNRLKTGRTPRASEGASVGASDLVPLAQMALDVIGVPNPLDVTESANAGEPLALRAKEGLSLMGSNSVSLGHGALVLLAARKLLRGFDLSVCFSLEGLRGNLGILDPAVARAHPQPGQQTATEHMTRLLRFSELHGPGAARFLQDPLSFRCAPQIHGAAYDTLEWLWKNWEIELNSVQDNPLVDVEGGKLVSHGNMDTTLLTLGMDTLRAVLATVVDVSAQRLHKLHWPEFSGLPTGLTESAGPLGGVQFLNLSHIAGAYAAKARARARPALLSYQGQLADGVEDHATLLPLAVMETEELIDVAWIVQALELTVASWAVRRRGLSVDQLGHGLRRAYQAVESHLPIGREGSEVFDLRPILGLVRDEEIVDLIDDEAPPVPDFEPPVEDR